LARTALFRKLQSAIKKSRRSSVNLLSESRRDFLKSAGLAAITLSIPAVGHRAHDGTEIAILGGGISGLGAAAQLQEWGIPYRLFEASDRLGGRILTQDNFNDDGQFIELGAELVDKNHTTLIDWAKKLGLELDYLLENRGQSNLDIIYVNGQYYNDEQFDKALQPFIRFVQAGITEMRKGLVPGADLGHWNKHHAGVVKYDNMLLTEFLDKMKDVDPWIKDTVALAYRSEFGLEAHQLNAIALLDMVDDSLDDGFSLFGASDESYRIRGGSSRFIEKLAERAFPKGANDPCLHLGHRLTGIRERNSQIELTFTDGASIKTYMADRVICTLPFSVLREVDGVFNLNISQIKKRAIREIGYGTHTKIMQSFSERYWWKMGNRRVGGAYIFTDLPSQCFWETSRAQNGGRGVLTAFLAGNNGREAGFAQAEIAINDLVNIYGSPQVESYVERNADKGLKAAVMNWSRNDLSKGSYCCLLPGQVTSLWGDNHVPELKGRLMFAGEHTSLDLNGFMAGALESGLRAAKQARKSISFWI
jgi:monoamine oxidase